MTGPDGPRLFLVDGYALIYRAFFALISRPLTTSKGENTSASWGIANFLQRLITAFCHKVDNVLIVIAIDEMNAIGCEEIVEGRLWKSTTDRNQHRLVILIAISVDHDHDLFELRKDVK